MLSILKLKITIWRPFILIVPTLQRKWGLERLSNLPKVTQPASSGENRFAWLLSFMLLMTVLQYFTVITHDLSLINTFLSGKQGWRKTGMAEVWENSYLSSAEGQNWMETPMVMKSLVPSDPVLQSSWSHFILSIYPRSVFPKPSDSCNLWTSW